jgi:protein-S-isoprenylcysteine O-methyltransferase Ste14
MENKEKFSDSSQKGHRGVQAHREDLTGENPKGDLVQLIAAIGFFILLCLDNFWFDFLPEVHDLVSWWGKLLIALPFFIIASWLAKNGMRIVFGEIRNPPEVITKGPFKYSRHPIYLGALLLYVGFILFSFSILSLIYYIFVSIIYNKLANHEERLLLEKFGDEYKKYQQNVPKWIGFSKNKN